MSILKILSFILRHPLNRGQELRAIVRFVGWQVRSRLNRKSAQFDFIDDMKLNASLGEAGVTGNLYCGLHEYEGMGFTIHFLQPGDLFLDVGANAGSYSVLAAAAGSRVIAFEPGEALPRLKANVDLNRLDVDIRPQAVGDHIGQAFFTSGRDTTNSLSPQGSGVVVDMTTLDALNVCPTLIKIDVETFEMTVLRGARETLKRADAVIIESADECHEVLVAEGFFPVEYDPKQRSLSKLSKARSGIVNTLYVRDILSARVRVQAARQFNIAGRAWL